jgi:magnesium-transporting ATPase (P-type)
VVKTGAATEFGKMVEKLNQREEATDFSCGMKEFGYLVALVMVYLFCAELVKPFIY